MCTRREIIISDWDNGSEAAIVGSSVETVTWKDGRQRLYDICRNKNESKGLAWTFAWTLWEERRHQIEVRSKYN